MITIETGILACLCIQSLFILGLMVHVTGCIRDIRRLIAFGRCLEFRILYLEGELTKEEKELWVERIDAPHNNMTKVREDLTLENY